MSKINIITVKKPMRVFTLTDEQKKEQKELRKTISLTPTQELVMEVQGARWRLGENLWTHSSKDKVALEALEKLGMIRVMHGVVERTLRASITDKGILYTLEATMEPTQ